MALGGIGGEGSALDRFQQARDLARRKLEAASAPPLQDARARAAELLRRKQAELGQGVAADRPRAAGKTDVARTGFPPAGTGTGGTAPAAAGAAAYGRAGAAETADPGPRLGRYVDFTA